MVVGERGRQSEAETRRVPDGGPGGVTRAGLSYVCCVSDGRGSAWAFPLGLGDPFAPDAADGAGLFGELGDDSFGGPAEGGTR